MNTNKKIVACLRRIGFTKIIGICECLFDSGEEGFCCGAVLAGCVVEVRGVGVCPTHITSRKKYRGDERETIYVW